MYFPLTLPSFRWFNTLSTIICYGSMWSCNNSFFISTGLFQDTGKDAYLKDLPNSLCKFETFMAKTNSGFLVGKEVSCFYNAWFCVGFVFSIYCKQAKHFLLSKSWFEHHLLFWVCWNFGHFKIKVLLQSQPPCSVFPCVWPPGVVRGLQPVWPAVEPPGSVPQVPG